MPNLEIIDRPHTDYIQQYTNKNLLVLHYTGGGTLAGMESTLAKKDLMSVHYAIDLNGKVYRYFPEIFWSYSTGTGQKDAKRLISIEFVNWGQLTRKGNELFTWTGKKIPWIQVIKCAPFRGFEYWQRLTPEQEQTARLLVPDIVSRWKGMKVTTHARIKATKLDYPPDYPTISELLTM